ncbi:M20/M25/M40 family metallo-hydrolase [Tahibacter harae]|uniref:M20/M25/M40 family metallo-hydrolase n=1 Tax=Tahibacter harae TaxID=2963937 RepID=A0ABT1QXI9_9GAMM|nr:M20/M25/M40 family metallo-hydrolase [Tahibacter harae]MCQ4166998.1 M20/M25/M40 family metallo-hydrolase [Tahibacter harae]
MRRYLAAVSFILTAGLAQAAPPVKPVSADEQAFRALYKQLVEINTTLSVGSCTAAAEAMAARLAAAGLPKADMQILAPPDRPKDGALIALYPGTDAKAEPILLLAHLDVVEARREDWQRDPFTLVEEDGFFYARGSSDDKAMAAVFTDSLIRYKQEGFKPRRGIKLALTCGEETSETFNSVEWLLRTRPETLKAAFVINEGAGGELNAKGEPVALQVQAGEKVYQDFLLEITNPGGHSSRPVRENAVVQLSGALERIGAYQFPIRLNPVTRAYFSKQAELVAPDVAADMQAVLRDPPDAQAAQRLWTRNPAWNGTLRTTCTPTMVEGGHAPNALPQRARANVNCRILPGEPIASVQEQLVKLIADDKIAISLVGGEGLASSPPQLSREILDPVRKVAEKVWPGVAVVPTQSTGATDGRFLNAAGIPTYGISGMFHDAEGSRAHGLNERIRVKSLLDGRRFLHELVKRYAEQ